MATKRHRGRTRWPGRACGGRGASTKAPVAAGQSLGLKGELESLGHDLRIDLEALGAGVERTASLYVVQSQQALEALAQPITTSAATDLLTWVSYPKAGPLGMDLNRDVLAALLIERGAKPVRQIALDATWSALRFRPR